jgi:hypothetical protein
VERLFGLRPLGSTPPLPQPLNRPRVVRAKSRVKTLQRRVRRGRKRKSRPARVAPRLEAATPASREKAW